MRPRPSGLRVTLFIPMALITAAGQRRAAFTAYQNLIQEAATCPSGGHPASPSAGDSLSDHQTCGADDINAGGDPEG